MVSSYKLWIPFLFELNIIYAEHKMVNSFSEHNDLMDNNNLKEAPRQLTIGLLIIFQQLKCYNEPVEFPK